MFVCSKCRYSTFLACYYLLDGKIGIIHIHVSWHQGIIMRIISSLSLMTPPKEETRVGNRVLGYNHRNRQGSVLMRTFEPTNEIADCWSATHSYNFIIRVK